jgi:hypothetical protein
METLPEKFLATAIKQVHKHNHRYLQTDLVVKSEEEAYKKKTTKKRIRGRNKFKHLVDTLDKKHEQFAKVYHKLGPIQYSARLALIENGIKSPSEGFLQKRKKDNLSELFAKMDQEPTINARMRTTGYDMPACLHDKIPISDIRLKDNHSDHLDAELRYRHLVPYLPFGEENKRKHPVPKLAPRTITGHPFDAMTFTQKKNLLMADEECQYCMEYSKENDFREDVDMQKFDTKTFTPLNPNVVFEFPGRTK